MMQSFVQLLVIILSIIICLLTGDYRISCFVLCGCIAALFLINLLFRYRKEKQLEEMVVYLMRLQDGLQLPEITKCNEGQIGILQSEIYKLVVLLQEQSNAATKEKNYLAGMLSDISHQIKTPITAITLMADLLMKPDLPAKERLEFAAKIDKQVSKITWLIRNLLTLSQLEADVLKLKKEQVLVSELMEKACQPLELLAEVKGVAMITDFNQKERKAASDELCIICDGAWTAEAVSNVVKNCIEHTSEGGEVRISVTQHNFAVNIIISDNGCGIAKEDLPYIFERFYKGKHSSKDSVGIGLALAKQIILRQNGVISADSEEGKGTKFLIKFYSGTAV